MTDRARLEQALIAADKAGDVAAARQLAAALRSAPAEAAAAPAAPPPEQMQQPEQPVTRAQTQQVGDSSDVILDPVRQMGSSALAAPVAGLAGLGTLAGNAMGLTEREPADVVRSVQSALTYQPRTKAGEAASKVAAYPFEKLAQAADYVGGKTADVTGSPGLGAAVNTTIQAAPALLMRRGGKVPSNVSRSPDPVRPTAPVREAGPTPEVAEATKRAPGLEDVSKSTPSIEELGAQAKAAYKRASDAGITISPNSITGLKTKLVSTLKKEGIDPTLHPSTTAALKRVTQSKGALTLDEVETLRKIASDAKKSPAPADQRLASIVVDEIDDYISNLDTKDVTSGNPAQAAALKEARDLYSRKMKATEIQHLMDRAELSAPNFSASGMENAIRTEFRALAKNDKRMRRFTVEEQAAIKKVAKGGPVENTLRMLGKFAPTGVVSTGMSTGAGFVAGGPVGAVALPAAGIASRYAATRMTMGNARKAGEIMRRGPKATAKQSEKKNALADF